MSRDKIKPPPQPKIELMQTAKIALAKRYKSEYDAYDFLLNFFSSADLVGIIEELEKK